MGGVSVENRFGFDNYPIDIRERDGLYYLMCKKLGITESDISLDKAYEKLNSKRAEIAAQLGALGITLEKITTAVKPDNIRKPGSMLAKYFLVIALICVPIAIVKVYFVVASKFDHMVVSVQNKIKLSVKNALSDPAQMVVMLNKVAISLDQITPERKEEIQSILRSIVESLKPFTDELKPLYDTNN